MLATRIAFLEGKALSAVHVALKVIGGTDEKISVPFTTVSQVQTLSTAECAAILVLEVVLNGTSNSLCLSCCVTVATGSLDSEC
jgi:hypothetical protein